MKSSIETLACRRIPRRVPVMWRDNTANRPFGRILPQDDMTATLADLYKTRCSRTRIAWAPETLLSLGMGYLEGSN